MECEEKQYVKISNKRLILRLVIMISILLAFAYYVYTNSNIFNTKLAYQTISSSDLYEIGKTKVIKERGKTPFYEVEIKNLGNVTLPESTYNKYIGNKYNAIRINEEKLSIYIDESYLIESSFSTCTERSVKRVSYPWDAKQAQKFTNKEIKETISIIKKIGINEDKWHDVNLPYEYTDKYCIYRGYFNGYNINKDISNGKIIKCD